MRQRLGKSLPANHQTDDVPTRDRRQLWPVATSPSGDARTPGEVCHLFAGQIGNHCAGARHFLVPILQDPSHGVSPNHQRGCPTVESALAAVGLDPAQQKLGDLVFPPRNRLDTSRPGTMQASQWEGRKILRGDGQIRREQRRVAHDEAVGVTDRKLAHQVLL